ncbi:hypothetical protein MIR68_008784 [Amoeboaphelidium protococcarum]|nr:hypothetical protein MIR68_008784 [Amoeboaphelidium protococcarum]
MVVSTKLDKRSSSALDAAASIFGGGVSGSNKNTLKYASLVILTLQNCSLILVTRLSRLVSGPSYATSTAVFFGECLKVFTAVFCHFYNTAGIQNADKDVLVSNNLQTGNGNKGGYHVNSIQKFINDCFGRDSDFIQILVPSVLYTIQNNLQYVAISHLDVGTYQVLAQLKIFTTAIFSVLFLQRALVQRQWVSIGMLIVGVAIVQLQSTGSAQSKSSSNVIGFAASFTASVLSGMAGVYTEKILKQKSSTSLWIRNVQMGVCGSVLSLIFGVYILDYKQVSEHGILYGYSNNMAAIGAVFLNAWGGLLTAVVVKYADSISKGFATSIAILLGCVGSYFMFNSVMSATFFMGASLVIVATICYGLPSSPELEIKFSSAMKKAALAGLFLIPMFIFMHQSQY